MDIIRRKKAVPVEVRRVVPPETIVIPGAAPMQSPLPQASLPQAPGVTQNFFYVNVSTPQQPQPLSPPPAPLPADSSPREVHYHTTNVYHAPRRPRLGKGTSFLGSLGFVLGGVAAGAAYLPPIVGLAKPVAVLGFTLAALGYLGALFLGRVGRGMPMLGMLACAAAYGLWLKNTGQPLALPKVHLNLVAPSSSTPQPASPATPAQAESKPAINSPPADPINLERLRQDAATRLGLNYQSAKTAAATADTNYELARKNDPMGSPELIAASQQHLQADSELNAIMAQLRADPGVAAAEK